jgi:hypothetical protein
MEELCRCIESRLLLLMKMRISGGNIVDLLLILGGGNKLERRCASCRI